MNRDWWFNRMPGSLLFSEERAVVDRLLRALRGYALLQIGGPMGSASLASATLAPRIYFLDDRFRACQSRLMIQSKTDALPIDSESMDIVLIAHALCSSDNPTGVLEEAHRVLKPNGKVIVMDFNRWSLWRLYQFRENKKKYPWSGRFYSIGQIKRSLCALDFQIELQQTLCFRPPIQDARLAQQLLFLEALGQMIAPHCGGVFLLMATKQVVGMTPLVSVNDWSPVTG